MSFLKNVFLSLLVIGFSISSFSAQAQEAEGPDKYVYAHIIANTTNTEKGKTIRLGLRQAIYPEWHTYWKNPGDSGTATNIEWDLPPGFSVSELEWPVAQKIPFGPLTNYGYEGNVVLLQNLTVPDYVESNTLILSGKVNLLVCHDICIPETHDVSIVLNTKKDEGKPDQIAKAESALPREINWKTTFAEDDEGNFVLNVITEDTSPLKGVKDVALLPEDWGAIDNNASASLKITDTGFFVIQKRGDRDLKEIQNLPVVLSYKNASKKQEAIHLQAAFSENPLPASYSAKNITIITALLFALFGGMILNLMPCVFPVLSMKALSLINLGDKEEKKARGYGIFYTLGILVSFAVIGSTLLALKAGGAQIGWGFQLQNPLVIITLAYLVFLIGLNLSGLFEFSGRLGKLGNITQKLSQKDGHGGAFFTGVLATLVATPCTAPFMGAALGFALTQPAYISMLVFLALGFGLALPYLALCFVPTLRSKLPRPGAWMETFRQFLAFPMYLTAVWLVWVLAQQAGPTGVILALSGMVIMTFAFWILKVLPTKGKARILGLIFVIIAALSVASTFLAAKTISDMSFGQETTSEIANWENFTPEKLETLLEGNARIFTNMTAAWCITCKVNEKIALAKSSTKKLFEEKNIEYLKGDWTNQDATITQYLNKFDRQGVPLYVYYGPRDEQTGKRPEPVVLPQLLTAGLVEKTILQK